jgi:hypothetical protein
MYRQLVASLDWQLVEQNDLPHHFRSAIVVGSLYLDHGQRRQAQE